MKKILLGIFLLIPWFFSTLFPFDYSFYHQLILPIFTPPKILFSIVWTLIYLGIAISSYQIVNLYSWKGVSISYKKALLINFLFNQSFLFFFFGLKSPFLGFISSIGTFISSLFLYEETSRLNEKSTNYLNLYILWGLFVSVLSLTTYILNV